MTDIERVFLKAIENDERVRIIYETDKGITERTVRPISMQDGEVYAYCYLRRNRRRFKLSSVLGAALETWGKNNG